MENMQTPEGKLIGDAQKRLNISSRKAAAEVGMSDTRWRNIVNGYQAVGRGDQVKVVAPAETLARMASVVEVSPEELIAAGREDAAREFGDMFGAKLDLARLIREQLEALGIGPELFVKRLPEGKRRAFYFWMAGTNAPRRDARGELEDALGWRRGSVTRVLEAPITEHITLSEVKDWQQLEEPMVASARELTTDELLIELTRRVGALQAENESLKSREDAPTRDMFDVAANSTAAGRNVEHLEDGNDSPG